MNESQVDDQTMSGDSYRVLLQIALLGIEVGETPAGVRIADVLSELRPDLPHASIVLAMSSFSSGQRDAAVLLLHDIVDKFPDSQLGKAMLAVCLQNVGRPGWQSLMESVIDDGSDEYAVGLACAILGRNDSNSKTPGEGNSNPPPGAMWA